MRCDAIKIKIFLRVVALALTFYSFVNIHYLSFNIRLDQTDDQFVGLFAGSKLSVYTRDGHY